MTDSPSIVPDLAELVDVAEQFIGANADDDKWYLETKLDEIAKLYGERGPVEHFVKRHLLSSIKLHRQNKENADARAEARRDLKRPRNVAIAAECIRRRGMTVYNDLDDIALAKLVCRCEKFDFLGRSAAWDAAKSGLKDPGNQKLIRESADRLKPNCRRSIFDGSKGPK